MFISFQNHKCFWGLINLLIFSFLVIEIVLSACNIGTSKVRSSFMEELKENFNLNPILSLSLKQNCDGGSSAVVLGKWAGTEQGCNCLGITNEELIPHRNEDKITEGKCTSNMTVAGCEDIPQYDEKEMKKWRGNNLCVQYASSKGYADYLSEKQDKLLRRASSEDDDNDNEDEEDKDKACGKEGYKSCGSLDYLGQVLCLPKEKPCPINDIVINSEMSYSHNGITYDSFDIPATSRSTLMYIHTTNKAKDKPAITKFTISEGNICLFNSEMSSNYSQYILDKNYRVYSRGCRTTYDDKSFDLRYTLIDTTTKQSLFDDNSIFSIIQALPGYPKESLNAEIQLSYRGYMSYKKECLKDNAVGFDSVNEINKKREKVTALSITLIVFTSVILAIHIVFSFITLCCAKALDNCFYCIICFFIGMHLLIFCLAAASIHFLNGIDFQLDCWDDYTRISLDFITGFHGKGLDFSIVVLSFALITICIYVGVILFSCIRAKPEKEKELPIAINTVNPEPRIKEPIEIQGERPKRTQTTEGLPAPQLINSGSETAINLPPIEEKPTEKGEQGYQSGGYDINPNQPNPNQGFNNNYPANNNPLQQSGMNPQMPMPITLSGVNKESSN